MKNRNQIVIDQLLDERVEYQYLEILLDAETNELDATTDTITTVAECRKTLPI